ncbi:HAMP domain-containing sensor histidine kinase [Streptomyces sp. NPDC005322]|uniref:sensor histidine kinase n=1 Tax=unclassified Streptomyces TaxID=2593676 RepID=UPI0033A1DF3A
MSAISALARRIARPQLPRRTVRAKLTLLYGGLFLVSGAALLAITYVLVQSSVWGGGPRSNVSDSLPQPAVSGSDAPPGDPQGPARPPGGWVSSMDTLSEQARKALARQNDTMMHELLVNSGIALALMSVISIVLGWIVAGRILRRLRTITAAAQNISATNLHERLALDGPDDELKELGHTFDGLLGRLESSFQAQRQFVANASHELRTPLARQRVLGQVALADPEATVESLRAAHERILVAGAEQERLIEALLTLTRSHAGIEVRQPFDLGRLVHEAVDVRRAEAQFRGVTLSVSGPDTMASGHRPLAERLVVNLVDNAIRYNVPDGEVAVTTKTVDGRAVLTVSNTGPVVPPDAVERLFQPFQRLAAARTGRPDGLGLGLSIVQAIAAAHDASLSTTARPEGGLTITVTFPPVSEPAPVSRRRSPQQVPTVAHTP